MRNQVNDPLDACCMCREIESGLAPPSIQERYSITHRVRLSNGSFAVLPTVSPLTAGHVLILPKRHVRQLAGLSASEMRELLTLVNSVSGLLAASYAPPYFFEHGPAAVNDSACGIVHAHLHLVPLGGVNR